MMQLIKDNFHMRIFCPSGSVILVTPQEDWTREDDGWAELIGRCAFYLSTGLTDLIKGLSRSLGKEFAGAELDAVLGPICSNLNVWQYSDLIHKQTPLTLLWPVRSITSWSSIPDWYSLLMSITRKEWFLCSDAWKFTRLCYSCAKCFVYHWTPGIPTWIS